MPDTAVSAFRTALGGDAVMVGSFAQLPSPEVVEIYGLAGFDFVILDLEHGGYSFDTLPHMLRAASLRRTIPIVRVGEVDPGLIARVLDLGAAGVMVPQVRSRADMEAVVQAAKYPPFGARGYCSGVRAVHYFSPPTFTEVANRETVVIPLIENLEAVANFDDILAVPGIDAVMVGPGDLSSALGTPGKWDAPPASTLLDDLVRRALATGLPVGMHIRQAEHASDWHRKGVRLFTYGLDGQMILRHFTSIRKEVASAVG